MFPIRLNSKKGLEQFNILSEQLQFYKKINRETEFRIRCQQDWKYQVDYLGFFLEDDKMAKEFPMNDDDIDNFALFNEQSDVCTCLRYFGGGVM